MPGKRVYFYPISSRNNSGVGNPYAGNLIGVLDDHFRVLNRKDASRSGIFNLVKYLNRTDIFFLNWIEDMPDKKYGYIQTVFFILMFHYLRKRKVTVCWVLHNKFSHYKRNRRLKAVLFRMLAARSTHIITHSGEGLSYINTYDHKHSHNIIFLHHPVSHATKGVKPGEPFDILIWGTLLEYKGVDRFLEYLHLNGLADRYHIMVSGRIMDDAYRAKLYRYTSRTIRIEDRFIGEEELQRLITSSRMILFTYKQESVLSSGALMDSLSAGATVVGPDTGAFRDLAGEGLVITYSSFDDLVQKADKILEDKLGVDKINLDHFLQENTWSRFGDKVADFLYAGTT